MLNPQHSIDCKISSSRQSKISPQRPIIWPKSIFNLKWSCASLSTLDWRQDDECDAYSTAETSLISLSNTHRAFTKSSDRSSFSFSTSVRVLFRTRNLGGNPIVMQDLNETQAPLSKDRESPTAKKVIRNVRVGPQKIDLRHLESQKICILDDSGGFSCEPGLSRHRATFRPNCSNQRQGRQLHIFRR